MKMRSMIIPMLAAAGILLCPSLSPAGSSDGNGKGPLPAAAAERPEEGSAHPGFTIPIVDAHNQLSVGNTCERMLGKMDEAGVSRMLIASDPDSPEGRLMVFVAGHPDRMSQLLRTKGPKGTLPHIDPSAPTPYMAGLEEVIVWHAQKKHAHAREMYLGFNHEVRQLIDVAVAKSWPCVIHMEFRKAGGHRDTLMADLEELLAAHPSTTFLLIHMGQLSAPEVSRLIEKHPNIGFLVSHTTPDYERQQPFTNFFPDNTLSGDWRALMISHPDRFVAAFDAAYAPSWTKHYVGDVLRWRRALEHLPPDVAHAIGHANAERLWHLPPTPLLQPRGANAADSGEAGAEGDDDVGE